MRKPAEIRLTSREPSQATDWKELVKLVAVATGLAAWLALGGTRLVAGTATGSGAARASADSAGPAAVTVEFLDDGRCHVSAEGQGFRSNATYRPQGSGDRRELRCAMPPVPNGATVQLTVVLPPGSARPAVGEPVLEWHTAADGRWTGGGSLTEWPDVIVVTPAGRMWTFWGPVAVTALLAAVVLGRRRGRRHSAA